MRRCLHCQTDFTSAAWQCPHCGFAPPLREGRRVFAPELAESDEAYPEEAHWRFQELQDNSFWFRARNDLIQGLAERYFASARAFLEIGCSTGYVLSALKQALPRARVCGSEIYSAALAVAAERVGETADLFQMDARHIPFTAEFDLIAACDVLEHIADDRAVLQEMHRALAPGGGLLLTVPQHPWLWSWADELACHQRRYRSGELEEKCRQAGFSIVFTSSFVTSLLPLILLRRFLARKRDMDGLWKEHALPSWANGILFRCLDWERRRIVSGGRFPWGGSRVVIARKNDSVQL